MFQVVESENIGSKCVKNVPVKNTKNLSKMERICISRDQTKNVLYLVPSNLNLFFLVLYTKVCPA